MDAFLNFLSSLVWPGTVLAIGYYLKDHIHSALLLLRQQISRGATLKYKDFELIGVPIDQSSEKEGKGFIREPAEAELLEKRNAVYAAQKNIFVVHRVRPTGEYFSEFKHSVFEVLIYLYPHKSYGRLNDVKKVEYYFGHYFGRSQSPNGTKYIVENGSDGFAVKVSAYGPMLCEARIVFHDGSEVVTNRYLDFEGTEYKFKQDSITTDKNLLSSATTKQIR